MQTSTQTIIRKSSHKITRRMTLAIVFSMLFVQFASQTVLAAPKPVDPFVTKLSKVEQEEIYVRLTGVDFSGNKSTLPQKAIKCGTSLAELHFDQNPLNQNPIGPDRVSPQLSSVLSSAFERATMQATYNSPDGHFKLHYNITGDSAVKNAGVDLTGPLGVGGPDGVPDFINAAGDIFDSVWTIILGPASLGSPNLGYPLPPSDGIAITALNTDSLYDIYFVNFKGAFFGATKSESFVPGHYLTFPTSQSWTSYILLDNDYAEPNFSAVNDYSADPLDAVRVTAAHEFFHAIHFGIDATEFESEVGIARQFWFEMSSVSMEEYQYDDINDYYGYLFNASSRIPFNAPHMSLETFSFTSDFPYAMGVFPIWLTDKFGPEIVRGIWLGCGAPGPNFLTAIDSALISFTGGAYDFHRAFREYGVALALSGERAKFAPPGVGFQEAASYPTIRDTIFQRNPISGTVEAIPLGLSVNSYPLITSNFADLIQLPQSNSNSFVFMHNVLSVEDGCFKPEILVNSNTLLAGVKPQLTMVAIPQSQFDTALIVTAQFDRVVVDTNLVIDESVLNSTLQALVDSFACHDTVRIDTLFPGSLNDSQPDTLRLRVTNIAPALVLPDPTRYSDVMLIVTQTSLNPANYENFFGPVEYPYLFILQDSSSAILKDPQPFSLRTPYPNPSLPENSQVIFEALRDPLIVNLDEITFSVSIFTASGELVRDNLSEVSQSAFTQLSVTWDLTNQSGAPVVSGVYIVLEKLIDGSGQVALSEVTKVVVIR